MGISFDYQGPGLVQAENIFEPNYEEKKANQNQDFYYEMNERTLREYEQFLESAKQNKSKTGNTPQHNNRSQSVLLEWSNLLQKQLSQEKTTMNVPDNKNKIQRAYKSLLALDERSWYDEMISLYRVSFG